jgi:hypothetical protein
VLDIGKCGCPTDTEPRADMGEVVGSRRFILEGKEEEYRDERSPRMMGKLRGSYLSSNSVMTK